MRRRYGKWAGNSQGTPEDTTRCMAEISDTGGFIFRQCSRKRLDGFDGLCRQHGMTRAKGLNVPVPPEETA